MVFLQLLLHLHPAFCGHMAHARSPSPCVVPPLPARVTKEGAGTSLRKH